MTQKRLIKHLLYCFMISPLFFPSTVFAQQPPAPQVRVMTIEEQNVVPADEYVGHVEAIQTVELRARVEGFLEEVSFTEGDYVQEGQVLYRIEPDGYNARVAMEKARVAQAEAELARAQSHLKRMQTVNPQSISALDLDNAVAAELAATANLAAARATLENSELNLAYTTISAPIAGRIGRTEYTRGNLVNPASGVLATIVQTHPVRVAYAISENDFNAVKKALREMDTPGEKQLSPRLILPGNELFPETGQVVFVDNRVDTATGTITVRARFDNADRLLLPGQYVTVQVRAADPKLMPVVPQSAVLVNQEGRYVLTVKDGIATPQPIVTGTALDRMWAVESGLEAGDRIIVSGIQKVQPGQPVTVLPADSEN
ncbi:efflux RND transporter periplasmic adaptor subunit [Desulfotignum phosphitoxidans]|uniref:Efflux pump periplasmic linker BepF n=1 Tax=Desulfotignum phosphitoxidans DSM 13687 TaxID=1286635 RepID=S0FWN2_9BACT|nr:efflux RND transporter periplasmic adaptor subunit [Desulfotignum phosphitoxidans]EMS77549.1 efflux pump periplasmic linker BepF [Desulfotignum phosphitoxidans DSM 13687]